MTRITLCAALAIVFTGVSQARASTIDRIGEKLADVKLTTVDGKTVNLLDYHTGKLLVIAYTGVGCPIAGRYAPRLEALKTKFGAKGLEIVGISANPQDSADDVRDDAKELGRSFPVLLDHDQMLTRQLDAKTTTVAFVVDKGGIIRYRGMIDDQYVLGATRHKARHRYLERAVRAAMHAKFPEVTRTAAPGCVITRLKKEADPETITYASHIKRILQENCQNCHRPKQIGPFSLRSYESARGWSAMIHSVIMDGRMPPWNASREFDGTFVNERRMPDEDRQALLTWISNGMPRGNPDEDPPDRKFSQLWRIGKPDKVYTMKKAFSVPADGVVEYQYFNIPTHFKKDKWIHAMEARAGASDVVHHILAFTVNPNNAKVNYSQLGLEDGYLCATVPGDTPSVFPVGRGKRLRAGDTIVLQVHYTTNGKRRKDKCKIAFVFSDEPVKEEVRTRGIYNLTFTIPAGDPDYEVRSEYTFDEDAQLLSLYPHMHFRGKAWKYLAHFPDGTTKTLLDVPTYDYNWQEAYILKKPVRIPKGTKIECIARFDNSKGNLVNPDPTKDVRFGEQSWEEMMIGYIDYVSAADPTSSGTD